MLRSASWPVTLLATHAWACRALAIYGVFQAGQAGQQILVLVGTDPGPEQSRQRPGKLDRDGGGDALKLLEQIAEQFRRGSRIRDAQEPVIAGPGDVRHVLQRQPALTGRPGPPRGHVENFLHNARPGSVRGHVLDQDTAPVNGHAGPGRRSRDSGPTGRPEHRGRW